MSPPTELSELLDCLVRSFVINHETLTTNSRLAPFLGLSSPQLSRIRTGVVPLTVKMARKFANRIGKTSEECEEVMAKLRPFTGTRVEATVNSLVSELTSQAILRTKTRKELESVLEGAITAYKKAGLSTERLEVALGAARIQLTVQFDLSCMSGLI